MSGQVQGPLRGHVHVRVHVHVHVHVQGRPGETDRVVPASSVVGLTHGPGTAWTAEGSDPKIAFRCDPPVAAGWYEIRLAADLPTGARPKLYIDTGDGLSEEQAVLLGVGGLSRGAVVGTATPIRDLRLDPIETPGTVELGPLSLRPLTTTRDLAECHSPLA